MAPLTPQRINSDLPATQRVSIEGNSATARKQTRSNGTTVLTVIASRHCCGGGGHRLAAASTGRPSGHRPQPSRAQQLYRHYAQWCVAWPCRG